MKKMILVILMAAWVLPVFGQWTVVNSGTTKNLKSIQFTTDSVGYAVGDSGTIIKTTNAGTTWNRLNSETTTNFSAISFYNSTTGFIVGNDATNNTGVIYKTTNSGSTWSEIFRTANGKVLNSVAFLDSAKGCAVGSGGKIYQTTNQGNSWTEITTDSTDNLYAVCFVDATKGFIGSSKSKIYRTTNGGTSWVFLQTAGTYELRSIDFFDVNNGAIASNIIVMTSNGGTTWNADTGGSIYVGGMNSIIMTSASKSYRVGYNGGIHLITGPNSNSISDQVSGTTSTLNSIVFTDINHGYIVGDNGVVLKTINGGFANQPPTISTINNATINTNSPFTTNFTIADDLTPVANLTVTATSANQILVPNANIALSGTTGSRTITINPASNQTGSVVITVAVTDAEGSADTTSFTLTVNAPANVVIPSIYKHTLPSNIPDTEIQLAIEKNNQVWVFGSNGVVAKSSDLTMTSWTLCNTGVDTWETISTAETLDGITWVIGTQSGNLYRSTNGGSNWTNVFNNYSVTKYIDMIRAYDTNNWLVVGDPGSSSNLLKYLKSADGGATWTYGDFNFSGTSSPWTVESLEMDRIFVLGQHTDGTTWRGVIEYNTSGSNTYHDVGTDVTRLPTSIKFLNPNTGLVFKKDNRSLWLTDNSCSSFNQVGILSPTAYLEIAMSPTSRMAYLLGGNKICAVGYDNNTIVESSLLIPAIANARAHASVSDKLYICGSNVENKTLYSNTPNGSAQAPTISAIRDTTINASTTMFTTFSISDNDLTLDNMQLRITSSNQAMLPEANIVLSSGNGGNWSLYATPKANIYGFTTIKIIYTDKENLSDTCSFNLAVNRIEWTTVPSGTGEQINSVCFPNTQTGYVCATNGVIQKSINGGQSWSCLSSSIIANLNSICYTDTNTIYACGDAGVILKTVDGGTNWVSQTTGVTTVLTGITFTDTNTGYAVGQSGTIIKTNNGGVSWTALTSGVTIYLRSVYFIDGTNGFAVGQNGTILKTNNSGTSWTILTTGTTNYLRSVSFVNASVGYATGASGTILKTIDGGQNWTAQTSNVAGVLFAVNFINPLCGIAAGQSAVLKTVDGGQNWIAQTGINNNTIYGVGVSSNTSLYAVGASGLIINCISPFSISKPSLAIFQNPVAAGYLHFALNIDKYAGLLPTMKVDNDNLPLDTLATGSFMAHYPLYLTGNHTALVYTGDTTITRTFTAARTGKSGGSFSCDNGDFSVSYPENTEEYTLAAYLDNKEYFVGHSDFKTSKSLTVRWKTKENKAIYCNGQELATYRDGDYLVAKNGKFGKFSLGEAILNSMTTELYGNYPNPFNPTTNIRFAIGMEDAGSLTQLKVYNIKGELVETLLNNQLTAGKHIISWNAARYASGVYYYTLKAGSIIQTAKMLMVK